MKYHEGIFDSCHSPPVAKQSREGGRLQLNHRGLPDGCMVTGNSLNVINLCLNEEGWKFKNINIT